MEDSGAGSGTPPNAAEDVQDPAVRGRLAALVKEWSAAIVSNDVTWIGAFMAAGWVIVSESGITDRDTFLGFVDSGDLTHSAMRAISPPRVRVHGDSATITARMTNTAHYDGCPKPHLVGPPGRRGRLRHRYGGHHAARTAPRPLPGTARLLRADG